MWSSERVAVALKCADIRRMSPGNVDFDLSQKLVSEYVARQQLAAPMSDDALRGAHILAILKSVALGELGREAVMADQAFAWADVRGLLVRHG